MQEMEEKEKYCYRTRKVRIKIERKIIFRGFQGLIAVTFIPSRENKWEQNPRKTPAEEKSLHIQLQIFFSMVTWFSIPTLNFIYVSKAQVKIFKHKGPEFKMQDNYLNSL